MTKGFKDFLAEANAAIETCSVQDALRLHQRSDWVFVDVRDGMELEKEGRIAGATHAPRGLLEFRIDSQSPMHDPVFASGKSFGATTTRASTPIGWNSTSSLASTRTAFDVELGSGFCAAQTLASFV